MPDPVALFVTVILLLPMGYLLLAAPAFLLVKLDIPPVTFLLRSMFSGYYLVLAIAGAIAAMAFAVKGRFVIAVCIGSIAVFAVLSRRWFLRRMDAELDARDAGDPEAVRQLRRLHCGGMLCNAVQLATIVASIPYLAFAR